jgi:phosphoesterase RecJ-like protein
MSLDWSTFVEFAHSHQQFLLLTHVRPDADALGSQIGMADALSQIGKSARTVIGSTFPERYRFLDPEQRIERYQPTGDFFRSADAIIILDTGTWNQLGECGPPLREREVPKFVIDHHLTQDDLGATRLVDVSSEATGRLVFESFGALGATPSPRAATALFAALAMDTGWFHHSNMKPATFELAARLTQLGASPVQIYEYLYERNSPSRLRLQGRVLDRLKLAGSDRIAYSEVYLTDYPETGAHPLETEDFVQLMRSVADVEVGILFIEQLDGRVKVSLRSRSNVDVSKLAEKYGGGGHARAAGMTASGPLAEARENVLAAVVAALK